MRYPPAILAILCVCLTAGAADPQAMLTEARDQFDRACKLRFSDPSAAAELYAQAAESFEKCGATNGKLLYNTGNAHFLAGDVGRAILNYRRAERLIPRDRNLRHNLDYARSRRIDRIRSPQTSKPLKTFLFWHYDITIRTRQMLFAVFYIPLWLFAIWLLFDRRRVAWWGVCMCAVISLLPAGSIMVELNARNDASAGVVLAGETIARKGDSQAYQPSFDSALHAGTEFTVLQQRSGWLEIQLIDGRQCWIPAAAASIITAKR